MSRQRQEGLTKSGDVSEDTLAKVAAFFIVLDLAICVVGLITHNTATLGYGIAMYVWTLVLGLPGGAEG